MKTIAILFLFLTGSAMAQSSKKENEDIIRSLRAASNEAIGRRNVSEIASYWLTDFVQIRGNGSYLAGKDTIASTWEKTFRENPRVSFIRNPNEVLINTADTLAWETGTWQGLYTYSKGGKYSAMWRKRKGAWKLQAELFVALD